MSVHHAMAAADALLPGQPASEGCVDARWQAIIEVGDFVETAPEDVWDFVARWGCHPQEDVRAAIATCLLEHLLEHHFPLIFPRVEQLVHQEPLFADTFRWCWVFGQAAQSTNAQRLAQLRRELE